MKKTLQRCILLILLLTGNQLYAQEIRVSGTVTGSDGTIPGVSVTLKNGTIGAATNTNGNFNITVPQNGVLVFSALGYETKEEAINGRSVINVYLADDAATLEDVVVVGYTSKKQSELSSSVVVVSDKELKGIQSNDLGSMLQGKVAGLVVSNSNGRPGEAATMVIRGVGSIGAGYAPLYVVDGIIGGSADPNDILSVTVLKDAAATGLYGSRASNGVIVITTKSGQSGDTRVSYNGSFGTSHHQNGNFKVMNSAQFYEFAKQGYQNFFNNNVAAGNPAYVNRSFDTYLESVLPASLLNTDTDWQSLLTRTGTVNNHHLSVSGGNEKTTFYLSGNYFDEKGTVISTEYQNVNLRANIRHKLSNVFTLDARLSAGSNKRPNEPRSDGVLNQYYLNVPWDNPYEDDGITPYNPTRPGASWHGNNKTNYIYDRDHYSDVTKRTNAGGDFRLEAKITDWMTFSTSNSIGFSFADWTQLFDKYHNTAVAERGRLSQTYEHSNSYLTSNLLRMHQSYGSHNFSGILGQEYSYSEWQNTAAVGTDMVIGLSALNSAGQPKSVGGNKSETGFLSYFGQLDYNYQDKYFLVGSLRRDASSRFGSNNQWGTFYSAGASWILNRENFLSDVQWLDLLKLKASYGTTGNANITNYLALGTYSFISAGTYDGNSGARPARLPNQNLSWEMAYTTNIGIEFAAFKRAKLEVDFYNKTTKDLLQSVPLSAASGFANQQRNVGSINNRGLDLNLSVKVIDNTSFNWASNFNFNINKNKVLSLDNGNDIFTSDPANMIIREGLPLRYFYMKEWAGVDPATGGPLWTRWEDEEGKLLHGADKKDPAKITTTDQYNLASNLLVGSAYPDFVGGFRNDFSYKNFSLSILTNMSFGQSVFLASRQSQDADGTYFSQNQMILQDKYTRWEKPGDIATHPQIIAGGNKNSNSISSRFLEDASFFRIQNIRLGYTFPNKVYGISNLNMYSSIDNAYVFTKFSGADPDSDMERPTTSTDASRSRYSPTRKVTFGINFSL